MEFSDHNQSPSHQFPNHLEGALEALKQQLSAEERSIWFTDLQLKSLGKGHFAIVTDGLFKKKKFEEIYLPRLHEIFAQQTKEKIQVEVLVLTTQKKEGASFEYEFPVQTGLEPLESEPKRPLVSRGLNVAGLDERLSFERYVLHEENRLALECAKKVTQKLGNHNPLYLFGPSGSGKTHLIQAIGKYYQENFPFLKIRYLSPLDFLNDFRVALTTKTDRAFRLKYRALDVLLIDDIQFFSGKTETCVEFFHLFNEIYVPGKQMVFTSDVPPAALDKIDERLKSRLASGIIAEIEGPKEEARRHLLDFYLSEAGVDYDVSVKEFLVSALPADTRRVMSAVRTLVAAESIYQEPVTTTFIRKVLGGTLSEKSPQPFSAESLLAAVVSYSKISLEDLKSYKRSQHISFYRQLAMYLLRRKAKLSLQKIAEELGGKSPASVTQAVQAVETRLQSDSMLSELLARIGKGEPLETST